MCFLFVDARALRIFRRKTNDSNDDKSGVEEIDGQPQAGEESAGNHRTEETTSQISQTGNSSAEDAEGEQELLQTCCLPL